MEPTEPTLTMALGTHQFSLASTASDYRGVVSVGSVGSMEPTDF